MKRLLLALMMFTTVARADYAPTPSHLEPAPKPALVCTLVANVHKRECIIAAAKAVSAVPVPWESYQWETVKVPSWSDGTGGN